MTRLKELRYEHGLTQKEVANAVGVSRQTINRFESGDFSRFSADTIRNLCSFFSVSPFDILKASDVLKIKPSNRQELVKLISAINEEFE